MTFIFSTQICSDVLFLILKFFVETKTIVSTAPQSFQYEWITIAGNTIKHGEEDQQEEVLYFTLS